MNDVVGLALITITAISMDHGTTVESAHRIADAVELPLLVALQVDQILVRIAPC